MEHVLECEKYDRVVIKQVMVTKLRCEIKTAGEKIEREQMTQEELQEEMNE